MCTLVEQILTKSGSERNHSLLLNPKAQILLFDLTSLEIMGQLNGRRSRITHSKFKNRLINAICLRYKYSIATINSRPIKAKGKLKKLFKGVINMVENKTLPFEAIGEGTLHRLVDAFYHRVGMHPDLAPIFPDDLTETARKQKQFLTQYLGGPPLYTSEHGHPMLRARHQPFEVTPKRAKAWLACMVEAMDDVGLEGQVREDFYARLYLTAQHMVNTPDDENGEET